MHKMTLILNNSTSNIQLTFRDEVKARAVQKKAEEVIADALAGNDSFFIAEDEYGHRWCGLGSTLCGSLLSNIQEELNYTVDSKILEHRAQNKLNQAIQMDPANKLALGVRQ